MSDGGSQPRIENAEKERGILLLAKRERKDALNLASKELSLACQKIIYF